MRDACCVLCDAVKGLATEVAVKGSTPEVARDETHVEFELLR